jgi:hypothetical protein
MVPGQIEKKAALGRELAQARFGQLVRESLGRLAPGGRDYGA